MINTKMLENRIARLEKLLKNEAGRRRSKVPEFEATLDVAAAREAADIIANKFAEIIGATVTPVKTRDIINSPVYGWLTVDDVDDIRDDKDARFAFHYRVGGNRQYSGYGVEVYPSENAVNLITDGGHSVMPDGSTVEFDGDLVYFPLSKWKDFSMSMIHDEDFESVKRSRKRAARKFESFESDHNEDGARGVANGTAKIFSQMIGARLTPSNTRDIVDSPTYGWSRDVEMDDFDARYTFTYDVEGYPGVSVYIRPTDNTICVWKSLTNGSNCEGAVDPKTGMCEWSDELSECSYPLAAWRNFDLEMIHDEEFESVKRNRKRIV